MLTELKAYLIDAAVVAGAAGAAYGGALIGVPVVYLSLLLAGAIVLAGYARWDERHRA